MEPQHFRFGGGAAETTLNPLVAVGMLIAIVLILTSPQKKGITPFLLACFTIPIGQVVVLGGLHFTVLRILIIAGLIRQVHARRIFVNRQVSGRIQSGGPNGGTVDGVAADHAFTPVDG